MKYDFSNEATKRLMELDMNMAGRIIMRLLSTACAETIGAAWTSMVQSARPSIIIRTIGFYQNS